ncbi:MAG: hypothetical protein ACLR6L_10130, partial [Agathobaculum sp.]
ALPRDSISIAKTNLIDSLRTAHCAVLRLLEKLTFSEQPLARNHAFERILKKNRALRAHFFFPCINSEIHAPGIYEFASQILFYACCRTKRNTPI